MSKRQEPEGFPEFWSVWRVHARHTDGRGLAREAFVKHVKAGADPQDIIDGAKCFFRTMKDRDREFVPLSATWLNRGSFEDLAEQERTFQARIAEAQQRRATDQTNVVSIRPDRPSEEERAAIVARARMSMRGGA